MPLRSSYTEIKCLNTTPMSLKNTTLAHDEPAIWPRASITQQKITPASETEANTTLKGRADK